MFGRGWIRMPSSYFLPNSMTFTGALSWPFTKAIHRPAFQKATLHRRRFRRRNIVCRRAGKGMADIEVPNYLGLRWGWQRCPESRCKMNVSDEAMSMECEKVYEARACKPRESRR